MLLSNFFTDWNLLLPYLLKGVGLFVILAVLGFIIGKLTYHEPEDDE